MVDIARLEIQADSRQVRTADKDLDRLNRTGTRTEQVTGRVNRGFMGMRSAATFAASALGGLSAALAIRGTFSTIAAFEQSMAEVEAISRATEEQMVEMTATARELGATTEFTGAQAAAGMKFLSMAGFEAKESIAAIPDVLNLATAATIGLGEAADITSNIMSGFGIAADNAAAVTDVMAAVSTRANTNINQLGDAMAYVAPVSAALEISIGDTAAAIGVLSDAGIQGSAAGTGLRRVLSSLANPTGAAAKVLKELEIAIEDVNPATNELVDIVQLLASRGMSAADALTVFGDRGGPAILALIENNPRLRELADIMNDVDGEAGRMAETMRDTLSGDVKTLMSSVQELALVIGDRLGNSLRNIVQALIGLVRAIADNIDGIIFITKVLTTLMAIRFTFWLATVSAQMAINIQQTIAYQMALLGMAGGINVVTASLTRLQKAQALIAAAFIGWSIGTWLSGQFEIVEKAGVALASGLHQMANRIGGEFRILGEHIKFAFSNPLDFARGKIIDFIEWLSGLGSKALSFFGLEGLAETVQADLSHLRGVTYEQHQETIKRIRDELKAEGAEISSVYADMFAEIGGEKAQQAASGVKEITTEVEEMTEATRSASDEIENLDELITAAGRVFEQTRTPLEQFNAQIELLNTLRDTLVEGKPLIDAETYKRAVEQAQDEFERLSNMGQDSFFNLEEAAKEASRNIHQALADFLFDPFDDGIRGMLDKFSNMLRRMAAEAAAQEVLNKLFGALGGGSFSDVVGNAVGTLFGGSRDNGGRGEPGKAYHIGTGAQPEMFVPDRPGSFIPANQQGQSVSVQMTVVTQDASSFRNSEAQIENQFSRVFRRATSRNS